MIKIREKLKQKCIKTREDKIELNLTNKAIKRELRERKEKRNNEIIKKCTRAE